MGTRGRERRTIWTVAFLASLPIGLVIAKNAVVFGSPSPSSWFGMNLFQAFTRSVPVDVRLRLVAEGRISSWAGVGYAAPLERYKGLAPVPRSARPNSTDSKRWLENRTTTTRRISKSPSACSAMRLFLRRLSRDSCCGHG